MNDQPETWPRRKMRREQAARYLQDVHGIPMEEKTLRNRNASGLEPKPEYLGTIPFYRRDVLDEWVERAFTPESPVAVTRRRARAAEEKRRAQAAETRPAGKRRQLSVAGGSVMTDHQIVLAIQQLLDGEIWTPETLEAIARVLNNHGYRVRDKDDRDRVED